MDGYRLIDSIKRRSHQIQKLTDLTRPNLRGVTPPSSLFGNCFMMKTGSVASVTDDHSPEDFINSQQMEVNTFCDALQGLKDAFASSTEAGDELVTTKLREVNSLLRQSLTRHQSLYAKDILEMATLLNSKIKSYYSNDDAETRMKVSDVVLYAIQNLSIAFEKSLSDSSSALSPFDKAESFENLNLETVCEPDSTSTDTGGGGGGGGGVDGGGVGANEVDVALLNVDSGIEKAIHHAMSWLDSAKFFLNYVEKRTALDADLAKHLSRLSLSSQQSIRNEKMLPLYSAFFATFVQDAEFAERIQKSCVLVQTEQFVQPLNERFVEHKKRCRDLRDLWMREERLMREAVENLRKSKAAYNARCRDLMKTKEATKRVIAEVAMAADGGGTAVRVEKRRKMEEEAVAKATAAQEHYEKCVTLANKTKTQMTATKLKILHNVRQLIDGSDRVLKMITIDYFSSMSSRMSQIPLQFQNLKKLSEQYEPGSVYAQYTEQLRSNSSIGSAADVDEPFVFQAYSPTPEELQEFRKRISPQHEILAADAAENLDAERSLIDKRSHLDSYAMSRSLDSSPVRSRRHEFSQSHHRKLTNSSSYEAISDLPDDREFVMVKIKILPGLEMSEVAKMHDFRRLRNFSRCRQCDNYIFYVNGFECSLCGLSCHKLCLRNLRWECGHSKRRSCYRSYSERPQPSSKQKSLPDRVPYVVKKCIEEIDRSGLEVKGIFRVSAVKSKVESLCQKLESEDETLDLSNESPHTVASLLRLYLRQLNDPLVPFEVCQELVELAKKNENQSETSDLVQKMKTVISRLPAENFWTCSCLVHHLKRVSDFSEHNQMSASNLSVVFGPTLLRMSNEAVSVNSLIDNQYQCRVVELLISHAQDVFGTDPIPQGGQNLGATSGTLMRNKEGVSEDSPDSVAVDELNDQRPTTTWFDLSPDVTQKNLTDHVFDSDKDSCERRVKKSNAEDVRHTRGMTVSSPCSPSYPHNSPTLLSPTDLPPQVLGRVAEPPPFQRMRAYSPQFHRRINNAAPPVRRETFQTRKARSHDVVVVKRSSSSDSDDDV